MAQTTLRSGNLTAIIGDNAADGQLVLAGQVPAGPNRPLAASITRRQHC